MPEPHDTTWTECALVALVSLTLLAAFMVLA